MQQQRFRIVTRMDAEYHVTFEGTLEELIQTHGHETIASSGAFGSFSHETYLEKQVGPDQWQRCADPRPPDAPPADASQE